MAPKKKSTGTKRKLSGFMKFMSTFRERAEIKAMVTDAKASGKKYPLAAIGKAGGLAWGKLSEAEKAKYK